MERRPSRGGQLLAALVLPLLASGVAAELARRAEGRRVPALFVFGDSTVDVGNNDYLPGSLAKADFPPNGIDFPGGRPTGRFSNGYNVADYLAQLYGFIRSPPAFLSLNTSRPEKNICKGINFASGGSGILSSTGRQLGEVIPMDAQLRYFMGSLRIISQQRGCPTASRASLLSRSVFLLSVGSNDLFSLDRAAGSGGNATAAREFITAVISKYKLHIKALYRVGAKRFGFLGVGTLGCCPAFRRLSPSGECAAELNDYALQFNSALRGMLEKLSSKRSGMKYSLGDGYRFASLVLENPRAYGFEDSKTACCGVGRFNGEAACTANATLCAKRSARYFWDWYHLSAAGGRISASALYGGPPAVVSPISFRELAED